MPDHSSLPRSDRSGINPATGQHWRLSDPEVREETKAEIAQMRRDPELAKQFLREIGVLSPTGRLSRRYGGR